MEHLQIELSYFGHENHPSIYVNVENLLVKPKGDVLIFKQLSINIDGQLFI